MFPWGSFIFSRCLNIYKLFYEILNHIGVNYSDWNTLEGFKLILHNNQAYIGLWMLSTTNYIWFICKRLSNPTLVNYELKKCKFTFAL